MSTCRIVYFLYFIRFKWLVSVARKYSEKIVKAEERVAKSLEIIKRFHGGKKRENGEGD